MVTFTKFLYDFLSQFFGGIGTILKGFVNGFKQIFNLKAYRDVINFYKGDLTLPEWGLTIMSIGLMIFIVGMFFFLIYLIIRKYVKIRKKAIDQDALLEEVATLNNKVVDLMKEKEEILAMKVSQLGLKPTESNTVEAESQDQNEDNPAGKDTRFSKLGEIDDQMANYKIKDYGNTFTLPELCSNFRNFAASHLRLFYTDKMMRLFISALASTKLVILQGISGTRKNIFGICLGKILKA